MLYKKTLFTGQWLDLPLEEVCILASEAGYDGLELACWGEHFNIEEAASSQAYCQEKRKLLAKYNLGCWVIAQHHTGYLTCSNNSDSRTDKFCSDKSCWGSAEKKRDWAIKQLLRSPIAAKNMDVKIISGLMGSPIWQMWYPFPPVDEDVIDISYLGAVKVWSPILREFKKYNIRYALEVHPAELAFDIYSTQRLLKEFAYNESIGLTFDPAQIFWQGIDPIKFLEIFSKQICNIHIKDVKLNLNGESGILGSHLPHGDSRRGWNFIELGQGNINYKEIFNWLKINKYAGTLALECFGLVDNKVNIINKSLSYINSLE